MTSFNYGGKTVRDIGLTVRCHLSMLYVIVSSMIVWEWDNSVFLLLLFAFYFLKGGNCCFPSPIKSVGVGNLRL